MCILSELFFPLDKSLTLPPLPSSHIRCIPDSSCNYEAEPTYMPSNLPFENSSVMQAYIASAKLLSEGENVKTSMELLLDVDEFSLSYLPGDTIGILPDNPEEDVFFMLERLQISQESMYKIEIEEGVSKKKQILLPHIPSVASAKLLFTKCVDLRSVVKKAFLRCLVDYTFEDSEKRRLKELCSREGTNEYSTLILNNKSSIIDILKAFPSCQPSLSVLLEHLPRLQPRPYSIASSPLENPGKLRIVFNVVFDSRNRRGICSGWLYDITRPFHDVSLRLSKLDLNEKPSIPKVSFYLRKPTKFRIPEDLSIPLIMVGAGTGVAPFVGFLEHRRKQFLNAGVEGNSKNLLIFGCRYPKKDELYKEAFDIFERSGVCNCLVSYSRSEKNEGSAKYVQDILEQKKEEIIDQILSADSRVFICGNGVSLGKDVMETLVNCIKCVQGVSKEKAKELVDNLEKNDRILKDFWV